MKASLFLVVCYRLLILPTSMMTLALLLFSTKANAQTPQQLAPGYYVVLGVFKNENNAIEFRMHLKNQSIQTDYAFQQENNYYYVFVANTFDLFRCITIRDSLRTSSPFAEAWIKRVAEVEPSNKQLILTLAEDLTQQASMASPPPIPLNEPLEENREVFLSLYNESNDRVVQGRVQLIDTDRSSLIALVNGNEYMTLTDPQNTTGQLTFICEASGYRKVQHTLNYRNPLTQESQQFVEEIGTSLIINFPLIRYLKGDVYTLYSVYFYNDAAAFLLESKFELNELLVMMKENPKLRIRLHGHSNGSRFGKIITVGANGDPFSLTKDTHISKGSSRELSEKRASLIKRYLNQNGIESDRVEIKAWGGKRPLYNQNSVQAKKNVRVEVEILTID